jgi:hypothetical protein
LPRNTTSNLVLSESYRPVAPRNEAPATAAATRAGGPPRPAAAARPAPAAPPSPNWAPPQDPRVVGGVVIDGKQHNDQFVVLQTEWRPGVESPAKALRV